MLLNMNVIIKYLLSTIFFIIIWWAKAIVIFIIGYLIVGERIMERPPAIFGLICLVAIYTSYLVIKKINEKPFFQRLNNKMNNNKTDKKEIKEKNIHTNFVTKKPNKEFKERFISKGWLRLHIVLSLIGGLLMMIIYSVIINDFLDYEDWGSAALWPLTYWLCILILWGISKFNNAIISKRWLVIYTLINFSLSITLITYLENMTLTSINDYTYHPYDDGISMFFGQFSFLIIYFILFVTVWLINGFKTTNNS